MSITPININIEVIPVNEGDDAPNNTLRDSLRGVPKTQHEPSGNQCHNHQRRPENRDTFSFRLHKKKLREVRRREGCYLLRSNLTATDPAVLWQYYIQLTEIEQAFKELKGDLSIRPIYHQTDERIEAHFFVAFTAYCLHVTLKHQARQLAPGLTPRSILEKFSTMQMLDVHLPTTDGRYNYQKVSRLGATRHYLVCYKIITNLFC